jgi:hypothetical protein
MYAQNALTIDQNAPSVVQTAKVAMHQLIGGQIIDKRAIAVSPERLGRAIATVNPVVADSIITKGEFTIMFGAVQLADVVDAERTMSLNINESSYGGGRMMSGMNPHMLSPQYSYVVFGDDLSNGVMLTVNQCLMQHANSYGQGALINVVLSHMLKEEANIGLGFGN